MLETDLRRLQQARVMQPGLQWRQLFAVTGTPQGICVQWLAHLGCTGGTAYRAGGKMRCKAGRIEGESAEIQQAANPVFGVGQQRFV